jgi:uncharacterized membrane protein YtjA (UPF0391 family)
VARAAVPGLHIAMPAIGQWRAGAAGTLAWGWRCNASIQTLEARVFRWAVICLIISLLAGGLGLTNISAFAKRLSMIFFGLFLLGFLVLLGFAYLVAGAVSSSDLMPALVAVSV